MGDHKRASFEERKAAAIARHKVEAEQKAARRAEIQAAKTPEQISRGRHSDMALMMMLGMMGGLGGLPRMSRPRWSR